MPRFVQRHVYGTALLAWLAGAGLHVLVAWPPQRRDATPPVSGNNWGQHVPRTREGRAASGAAVESAWGSLRANLATPLTPGVTGPRVPESSFVDPAAVLWGDVRLGEHVLVAPFVSIRADEGAPVFIGSDTNVQDGAVIHGLPTHAQGEPILPNTYEVEGQRYSVYVAGRVSIEHQAQVHGPAWIEQDVWVGMQALVSGAHVGRGVVIEPRATVLGVRIPAARYVPAGVVVNRQSIADQLPEITASYPLRHRNRSCLKSSRTLVEAYAEHVR